MLTVGAGLWAAGLAGSVAVFGVSAKDQKADQPHSAPSACVSAKQFMDRASWIARHGRVAEISISSLPLDQSSELAWEATREWLRQTSRPPCSDLSTLLR
jgi:hypothetical protein